MMTREEYIQLLAKSPTFKNLDVVEQEKIRAAEGAEMEENVKFYQEEAEMVAKAYGKLMNKSEEIVIDAKYHIQNDMQAKLSRDETKVRASELDTAESLIKNITP